MGNLTMGGLNLKDTEFLFALKHSRSEWNKLPYENDASGILKVDLWANGKFSPFLFVEATYDSTQGLDNRTNLAIGLKYRIIGNILSISYALMYENETYVGWSSETFSRHSIRPKFKKLLTDGIFFQTEVYYKPTTDGKQYLVDWRSSLSISTPAKWLSITVDYLYKFNNNPTVRGFTYDDNNVVSKIFYKKVDTTLSVGLSVAL